MNFDIDSTIFIIFLFANLVLGLWSSRGITSMKEYAVGDRNFSTATLVATIVATAASGSFFFNRISETYNNGLYYIFATSGIPLSLVCIGYFLAPRMSRFLGKLSIADAMGSLYGDKVRIISALASIIMAAGLIAVQFKVTGSLFEYCFNIDPLYGVLLGATIVTLYSSLGGIKSVTFTDVIQFITFGTIIPIIGFFLINEMESLDVVQTTLQTNTSFDYMKVFDFSQPKSIYYLFLFGYFASPSFDPPMFQRMSMAKNVSQAQNSFIISGALYLSLSLVLIWVAILLLSTHPELAPKEVVKHLLFNYSYPGFKGMILVGIMAMVMSTADSYVNCTAVTCIHDFFKPLKINFLKNDLNSSRVASMLIGALSLIAALKGESLLKIILACNSVYMPVVTIPFTLAIFGFKTTSKSVLIGMMAGISVVIYWNIANITTIDPIVPGMLANLVLLLGSHYLLGQVGGWTSTLPKTYSRKPDYFHTWSLNKVGSNLITAIKKSAPPTSGSYIAVGSFGFSMLFATMHSMPMDIRFAHLEEIKFIIFMSLVASTLLLSQPLWLWKENRLASGIIWNFVIFAVLIVVGFGFVVLTNFATTQIMIFMINLIIIAGLLKWQLALFMIPGGILLSTKLVRLYFGVKIDSLGELPGQLQIVYLLLLVTSVIVVIFKPKQEHQELAEEKNEHLLGRIDAKDHEVQDALALKAEFIRNVNHEYNTPITGVMSMAEAFQGAYDQLSEEQKKEALDVIVQSSRRLKEYDENITTLARLNKSSTKLIKDNVNFSDLLYDRVKSCKKLYHANIEDQEFILDIEEGIIANIDKIYMIQLLDNLIINAITYCTKGKINLSARKKDGNIELVVEDEGIGIPKHELLDIFEPFVVSSKTKTGAGGRGVGLAVCKRIAEVHGGSIIAESDGVKGAVLRVMLPSG